ncbi:MAG: sigma-70 family RNA polymerase sigma factor [Lachnospiraceae bacterium]|jgi:RNA polymerase sigma-70 factor (ECF subfamily)|nr:sigma-70 family RNA polymerase sigma factor [Lachnospiraceae bacterium]
MDSIILEEEVLMENQRAYSTAEIEDMVKQYGNMVFRLAFVKMKRKESADDIFQEVFIKLIKLRSRLDGHEHEKAWLIKTTLNCCKDIWKSAWVRHVVYEQLDSTNDDSDTVEKDNPVYTLVLKLPDKYRVIVHLYYYEEFSIKEISVMLKMNGNTVSTRLKRAREILKKELVKGGFDYEI